MKPDSLISHSAFQQVTDEPAITGFPNAFSAGQNGANDFFAARIYIQTAGHKTENLKHFVYSVVLELEH
ncbi:hypothetical protein [Paenibacillus sp. GYB003]|uniref:hypothetical protein n=1 Tax=Paenibacillus sp. GYB003 TaxID=2994392 RepID=UPI002F96A4D7